MKCMNAKVDAYLISHLNDCFIDYIHLKLKLSIIATKFSLIIGYKRKGNFLIKTYVKLFDLNVQCCQLETFKE